MFASFHLEPRLPLFGRVADGKMVYSPVGEIAVAVIEKEACRTPDAQLKKWVVMPDHIHLRIYLRPGQREPLKKLGRFVYNVKAWIRNNAKSKLGVMLTWQKNYHDWICLSREIIEIVDKYIENNPLKWWLMHGNPPPLKMIEPMVSDVLPGGEWWSGVGNVSLLGGKLAAVRLSRSILQREFGEVAARLMDAVDKGYTLAGTWISPCERAVWGELIRRDVPIIRASQDPLAMIYRPKGDEPGLFAKGRYLVLSRPGLRRPAQDGERANRGAGWHGINDALEDIAVAGGGVGLYVKLVGGRLDWRFRRGDRAGSRGDRAGSRGPAQDGGHPDQAGSHLEQAGAHPDRAGSRLEQAGASPAGLTPAGLTPAGPHFKEKRSNEC